MTTTSHPNGVGSGASESEHLLKTDVLGRTRKREVILDIFESRMTGQTFAVQNDILSPRFSSKFRTRFP